ncbi:MAG: alpha/beta fold hydrolase [Myxococcota bacterium]|nr:alpha/beta fold hydrolase [Myxococcota bacterium]
MRKLILVGLVVLLSLYGLLLLFLYRYQEKLIFFPQKIDPSHRFSFPVPMEELWIESQGIRLHTLKFTKSNSKGVILFFHGNAGSLDSWGGLYEDFQRFDYDLWILDYRGYGKSEGSIQSEESLHQDARAFYQTASLRYTGKEIIIYGRSIGTGIAASLAAEYPPNILFLETPYYNLPDLVRSIYPFIPSFLVRYKLRNDRYVQNQRYPIHLIHGDKDGLIPHHCSERLSALADNITLHTIQGAEHNNISAFPSYHALLRTLLSSSP